MSPPQSILLSTELIIILKKTKKGGNSPARFPRLTKRSRIVLTGNLLLSQSIILIASDTGIALQMRSRQSRIPCIERDTD